MTDTFALPRDARALIAPLATGGALEAERLRSLYAAATWSCLVEPGDGVAGRLVGAVGYEAALHEVIGGGRDGDAREAAQISSAQWHDALDRWRPRLNDSTVRDALERAARARIGLVTRDDPSWPSGLADLGDHAPLVPLGAR